MATIEDITRELNRRKVNVEIERRSTGAMKLSPERFNQIVEVERVRLAEEQASEQGPFGAAAVAMGRGLTTIGRAVGLAEPESPFVTKSFEELQRQHPISTTIGEVVGEALPFLPAGVAAGGIKALAPRVLASAGLGATESAAISRGRGEDVQEQARAAGFGGAVAGAIESVLPIIGRLGSALVRKVTGRAPVSELITPSGVPTPELQSALDSSGLTIDDLGEKAQKLLSEAPAVQDQGQAVRSAFLQEQGLDPLKAQVTRNATDFQAQQEARKTSGRVREALERQEAILTTRFNQAVLDTGGQADTATNTLVDALVGKATVLDQQISDLYNQARQIAPGEKNVRLERLSAKLRELAPTNRRTGGAIEAIVGDLKVKGVLDDEFNIVGKIDVETSEDVRKLMNELYDAQNPFANGVLRQLKDTLDDDVFTAAGQDVFKEGRKAKATFEQDLARAKISKFDSRKANLVRDILENTVNPDNFAKDVVFSKKWRAADIQQLKDYVSTDQAGKDGFNDLRASVMDHIKNKSFIGPEDELGNRALSRRALETQIANIGKQKMNVLFTKEEQTFLRQMLKVSKLREPVSGTALGKGPSAQGIAALEKKLANLPVIGALVDFIGIDASGRIALKAAPTPKGRVVSTVEKAARGTLAPAAAAIIATEEQN